MREPGIDEQEFGGEQHARDKADRQRAIDTEQGNVAQARPRHQKRRGKDRPQAALHYRADVCGGQLGRHVGEAPDEAAQHHGREGG